METVIRIETERQFLVDVVITAVEGGIGYWARVSKYDPEAGTAQLFASRDELDEKREIFALSPEVVERGINALLAKGSAERLKVHPKYIGQLFFAIVTHDAGEVDAELADIVVQAGVFDRIIYG